MGYIKFSELMDAVDNIDPTVRKVLVNEPQLKYMLAPIIDPPNIIQPAYCKYPEFFYIFATCKYEKEDVEMLIKNLRKMYRKTWGKKSQMEARDE